MLFADLVGFTAFSDGRDPEHVRNLQQRYFSAASEAIIRHGGRVEKFVGDAVMAVWGTPVAHEDDAQRAVRAALEIVKAVQALGHRFTARSAIVTGEAAVSIRATDQAMVAGDMVNTAARLQGSAARGDVLADRATVQAALSAIAFEPLEDRELKGKAAPVPAWRAVRVLSGRARDATVEPPFVGRVEELRRLKDLVHAVGRERRIRLMSITGPAGIGKSRLVDELRIYAEGLAETIPWHTGRSPSYGERLAFWALGEMVRRRAGLAEGDSEETTRTRVASMLAEFVPDAGEREWIEPALHTLLGVGEASGSQSMYAAWRTFFERVAQRGTTVLVFEDLQWADTGTFDFIEHLLDWSRAQPIVIITMARPELLETRPGWGTHRSNSAAMTLEPLPHHEMRALLSGVLPGLPTAQLDAIVRRAEGMPLYAVETVRALVSDGRIERRGDAYEATGQLSALPIPASLRSLIASRLDALVPEERSVIQYGSVLGQSFGIEALASVSSMPRAELEPRLRSLVRRELLEIEADPRSPERGQYRFVQSLVREVAYETLSLRERRSRHLAAARFLEAAEAEEVAGALASHYLSAYRASDEGPEADAVAAQARVSLRAAADRAAKLGAHEQALRNVEHALSITNDSRERAELLERAAASATAAALPEAPGFARHAVEAYRAAGDAEAVVRATAVLGDVLIDAAEVPEALSVLAGALTEIEGRRDEQTWGEAEALLLAVLARAHMRLDQGQEALAAADRALVLAERKNLERVAAVAIVNKGSALTQLGRRRESAALLEGGIRLAEAGGWSHLELRARGNLTRTISDDDPRRALELLGGGLELARRLGDRGVFLAFVADAAALAMLTADAAERTRAFGLIDEALGLPGHEAERAHALLEKLAWKAASGDDVGEDLAELERMTAQATDPDLMVLPITARALLLQLDGEHHQAMEEARRAMERFRFATGRVGAVFLRAALRTGSVSAARWLSNHVAGLPFGGRWSVALFARIHAGLAALEGREEDALAGFARALDLYRELGILWEWAQTAIDARLALPEHPRTTSWVGEARRILQPLYAAPFLTLIETLAPAREEPVPAARNDAPTVHSSN